ncbi:MAG: heme-copper oxidase subunit III [Chloroflexota bacterium]
MSGVEGALTGHPIGGHASAAGPGWAARAAERRRLLLGVRLFILSEVMLFGALFAAYFILRAEAPSWPPLSTIHRPELGLVTLNTLILLSSSGTIAWAVARARADDRRGVVRGLAVTLGLGAIFLVIQAWEFTHNGFGLADGVFGSTFYTLTGFHGAHVFGGLLGIAVVLNRARLGLVDRQHDTPAEAVSYYWHFVDVVWLTLVLTLYVL